MVVLADILDGGLSNPAKVKRVVDKLSVAVLLWQASFRRSDSGMLYANRRSKGLKKLSYKSC